MSEIIELTVTNGTPTTTSLAVADRFGKQHKNVLRDIEALECSERFRELNFEPTSRTVAGPNGARRLEPMYTITKDGFVFLAMGFTGKEAAAWKERYIAAFNALEVELLRKTAAQQLPRPGSTLFLSHAADIMVAADRTFRSAIRSGRSAGMSTAQAIRRANHIALDKTGVNLLDELQAHDHVNALDAQANAQAADEDKGGLQRFWAEYEGGGLAGAACIPLLSTQAYQLYTYWCLRNDVLALSLPRMVHGLRAAGLVRHVRKRHVDPYGGQFGPSSFLLPAGPLDMPEGISETSYLGLCVLQIQEAIDVVHN